MGRFLRRKSKGQTAVEYMLAVSVVVIAIASAFWLIFADGSGPSGGGPAKRSFKSLHDSINAPYP